MQQPIYLDYAATTPVDPDVARLMAEHLTIDGVFGNPASRSHLYGWKAEAAVESARRQVADLISADPREIVWTSGATESDNLALKGAARFYRDTGRHIVTSRIEHKAVLDTCEQLEREGFEVTYLTPTGTGRIEPEALAGALRDDTVLVSLMHANNEVGTLNDIEALGRLCRERGVIFHVDAAQSVGKVPLDVQAMDLDLVSISAHKLYGPKGAGALYVRRRPRVHLEAQIHGGGHERGMRSGTLATHQIVGMGEACRLASERMSEDGERVAALRDRLWEGVRELEGVYFNGDPEHRLPGILNLSFAGVEGESLLMSLKDLAVSTGSACSSATLEPSYVLRALGREDELALSSLRFSLGRYTTAEEIDRAVQQLRDALEKLRKLSASAAQG